MPRLTDSYSKKELEAMTTLPVKAGLWIRLQDVGRDNYCDKKELEAAKNASGRILKKFGNVGFIKGLISYYQSNYDFDDLLEYDVEKFEEDVNFALSCARKNADPTDLNTYKIAVFETAEQVAKAAGSWGLGFHNVDGSVGGVWGFLGSFSRLGRGPKVSAEEKQALNHLIHLLKSEQLIHKYNEFVEIVRTEESKS